MSDLEGKPAPDFALEGSDGKTHRPGDYGGRTLVLFFYPKDDTPGCTAEACAFRDFAPDLGELDAVALGVSADSLDSHRGFVEKHGLNFVLLSDPTHAMIETYGAWGEKKNYGRTYEGIIRSTVVIGPDGVVRKHWPKVSRAADHPAKVMDYLRG